MSSLDTWEMCTLKIKTQSHSYAKEVRESASICMQAFGSQNKIFNFSVVAKLPSTVCGKNPTLRNKIFSKSHSKQWGTQIGQ